MKKLFKNKKIWNYYILREHTLHLRISTQNHQQKDTILVKLLAFKENHLDI